MPTFRKRNGKWQAQVRRAGYPAQSRTFQIKADAKLWARQAEAQVDCAGLPAKPDILKKLTVGELIDRYIRTVAPRKAACTVETVYLRGLKNQQFACLRISQLSPQPFARSPPELARRGSQELEVE